MSDVARVALVTGGSRGIGRAIVEALAASGWHVAFTFRSGQEPALQLCKDLEKQGSKVATYQADARDFDRAGEVVAQLEEDLGPVGLLVNNAGIKRDTALFRMSAEEWREVIETNLGGTFHYSRAVIYGMIKRKQGVIVNIVSVSGMIGLPGQANYSASKAGMIGFTKSLAKEVARFNVRVNAVAPGFIETDMLTDIPEAARTRMFAQIPMGFPGAPSDVAKMVTFLADEDARYITGKVIAVDGGML